VRNFVVRRIRSGVPDTPHERFLVATPDAAAWNDSLNARAAPR